MNGRDWIRQTLSRRETGPVPYNLMLSPPAQEVLERHYRTRDLETSLALPIRMSAPASIKPLYADPDRYGQTVRDEFGVVWSTSRIDRGAPVVPCLPEAELAAYRFPDPAAPYRFAELGDWCAKNREHYTILWVGDLWERGTFMRGMEALLLDVVTSKPFVRHLLRGITDYILDTMRILFERFAFDGIAVSDDYGTQSGMIMSPWDWRHLVRPCLAEIYASARRHGRSVFHHSCGDILPIIPDLIDLGLDILHPIQPEAMEIEHLKREFGRDLSFCGGLGTQRLLPRGTPQEIRREVRRLKDVLGSGGGYILEPGITVQADVPLPNLLALIDEARAGR